MVSVIASSIAQKRWEIRTTLKCGYKEKYSVVRGVLEKLWL